MCLISAPLLLLAPKSQYQLLHGTFLDYSHLRVFGYLCYPNLSATTPHKLAPRSAPCIFLGYPSNHKGYRCLDILSRQLIISQHVVFDKSVFPYAATQSGASSLDFLLQDASSTVSVPPPSGVEQLPSSSAAPTPAPSLSEDEQPDPAILYAGLLHLPGHVSLAAPAPSPGGSPTSPHPAGSGRFGLTYQRPSTSHYAFNNDAIDSCGNGTILLR